MPENEHSKKIIFLTDNDEDDRMLLHEALGELKKTFTIVEFCSAGQLLEHLYKKPQGIPDYIFLDILMPGMDGFDSLERLRSGPAEWGKIKIIIYSFQSSSQIIEKAFELGADFYAVKPARYDHLKELAGIIMESSWERLGRSQRIFHAQ